MLDALFADMENSTGLSGRHDKRTPPSDADGGSGAGGALLQGSENPIWVRFFPGFRAGKNSSVFYFL